MNASLVEIRQRFADLGERWRTAKQTKTRTFLIAIGAVILALYLGFGRGDWMTGGTAQRMAATTAEEMLVERLTGICVAQSNADSQQAEKLAELKELTSFRGATFVKEQGWATMPGETTPDNKVASECASQLKLMAE